MQIGYVDIQQVEIDKYLRDVESKRGICDVLPAGRFVIDLGSPVRYNGLVCHPMDMGGRATGVGVQGCKNCLKV